MTLQDLNIRPLRKRDWRHIETLFGAKGACGGCWCMAWRVPKQGKAWETMKGEANRQAFKALVESGQAKGLLAYIKGVPVGWCSIGPREHFPKIENSPSLNIPMPENAWVVSCIFIAPAWRGHGIGGRLIEAAAEYAKHMNAAAIYGYPNKSSKNKPLPAAFVWTGLAVMYRRAGFRLLSSRKFKRPVYRKALATLT